ncbi:MAG: hypothetical protein EOP09_05260 [Proteobacteria bacterium]|nr:MAG: hypothetical protein EOP09_05260 [Pseudomonadota bacterium]
MPHGADTKDFFEFFPEIKADPELQKVWPIFETYLAIEQDIGASELAHAVAYELLTRGISARVVEVNYPRGIVDGGRLRDHCLRGCLPPHLSASLNETLLRVHETSLTFMDRLYESVKGQVLLLDVHTMASYCPVDELGKKRTFPVSFPRLEAYVNQYLNATRHAYQRKIDLICADESGLKLADPRLLAAIAQSLDAEGYMCLENEPYHAAPIYLSHQHMQKLPGLSIDIPKFLISSGEALDELQIDPFKVKRLAETLALGTIAAFEG